MLILMLGILKTQPVCFYSNILRVWTALFQTLCRGTEHCSDKTSQRLARSQKLHSHEILSMCTLLLWLQSV